MKRPIRLKIVLFLFILSGIHPAFSQNKASVSGVVKDASTGESLVGANIYFKGTGIGTVSDVNGKYEINDGTFTKPGLNSSNSYSTNDGKTNIIDKSLLKQATIDDILKGRQTTTVQKNSQTGPVNVPFSGQNKYNTHSGYIQKLQTDTIYNIGQSGVCISPDNSKLYVPGDYGIYQFKMDVPFDSINNSSIFSDLQRQ